MRILLGLLVLLGALAVPAQAEPAPCALGGPAGTASLVRLDLPRGSPSLALRVTTPTTPSAQTVGTRSSWHLATQVALVRVGSGALLASRVVQSGSSPRAVAASADGQDVRESAPSLVAPFVHTAADVPAYLGPGHYLLVAYGTDGSNELPNPSWSVEASFGTSVSCVALPATTRVVDRDQTAFHGGTQVTGYGVGLGTGVGDSWAMPGRYVVGFADASVQGEGDARLDGLLPHRQRLPVHNGVRAFSSTSGGYRFTASWSGAFPLVLVCAVGFTP